MKKKTPVLVQKEKYVPPPTVEFTVLKPLGARVVGDIMEIPCDSKGHPLGPLMRKYLKQRFIEPKKKTKSKSQKKAKPEE